MRIGRRPLAFLVVAIVCLLLVPLTPEAYRMVNVVMIAVSLFWFVMLSIEEIQGRELPTDETPPEEPFDIFEGDEQP